MKVINASFFIKEEKRDEFLEDMKLLMESTRKEEGCMEYNLYEAVEETNKFIMVEIWENDAAIEGHNQNPLLHKLFSKVPEFSSKEPVLKVSELIENV